MAELYAPVRSRINWALVVLALVLLLTALSAWFVNNLIYSQQNTRFEREVDTVTLAIEQRLANYTDIMRATRGLWNASGPGETIEHAEFARYIDSVELPLRFPGVQGLGYAAYVTAPELGELQRRVRAEGLDDFTLYPDSPRPVYVPVTYLQPQNEANNYAMGFDMFSEPRRRAALIRARDSGDIAATAPLTLVQERRKQQSQRGLVIYLPVYRNDVPLRTLEERREATLGFVYAPLRMGDFMSGTSFQSRYGRIDMRVSDDGAVLFGSLQGDSEFTATREVDVGGRTWDLAFSAPAGFARDAAGVTPPLVLALGFLIAAAAYWATNAQVRARQRAEEVSAHLAQSRANLDKSRAEFAAIFRSMSDAAIFADPSGAIRLANDAAYRNLDFDPADLRRRNLSHLHADEGLSNLASFAALTTRYRRRDGGEFYGEAQRTPVRNESGEIIGQLEVLRDMTDRIEADRALRESEVRYRGVLDAMPQLVWVTDPDGRHQYFNSRWYAYTGLTASASLDRGFAAALHPDDREQTVARWDDARRTREPFEAEFRLRSADGTYHWYVARATPIRDARGSVIEWVGACTDIQNRIEIEGQLRRGEARYRGLIEGMPLAVWLADPAGNVTFVNRRWRQTTNGADAGTATTGTEPHDGRAVPPAEFFAGAVHPDDTAPLVRAWLDALRGSAPLNAQARLRQGDGSYHTHAVRARAILDDHGQVIEWAGTFSDIEEQVQAEANARLLADVTRLLGASLETNGDLDGVARALTGAAYPAAAISLLDGTDVSAAAPGVPAELQERLLDVARRAALDQREQHGTLDAPGGPGPARALLALPLSARERDPLGALTLAFPAPPNARELDFARELGSRMAVALENRRLFRQVQRAQQEVTDLNQTLEARVQTRTLELQEANRELEAFSYSVSHDLRTPLRHVVGFADLLRRDADGKLDEKGERYLKIISDAAVRMSALIDDLLNFSRMGRQELRSAPVDLAQLTRDVVRELTPEFAGRDVRITISDLPVVNGDANLLRLVLTNLIGNAAKYSRTRDASLIDVTATREGQEVVVTVTDNGVGFDDRFADKLFGVFQRLHRSEEFEGTGIGLANVRRIVHRHGGRVWAHSELGKGASFSFTLPVRQEEREHV